MSLLREIQNDLAGSDRDVTGVLRKCKILAARLGSDEFARWIGLELNGYPESQPTPEYRRLAIAYYARFVNVAWQIPKQPVPIDIVPEEYRDSFQHLQFREGMAKVTSFIAKGATVQRPELIRALQGTLFPDMSCLGVWLEISRSEFEQLVSAVKNRILDFVLEIEAENPSCW